MTAWDLFILSLTPEAVMAERSPTLRDVIGEQFGAPAHKRMLREHEKAKEQRRLMVAANTRLLAAADLGQAVAEARGWEDRKYTFEEWQIKLAVQSAEREEAA